MSTLTNWLEISPPFLPPSTVSRTTPPTHKTGGKLSAAINVVLEVYLKPT